MLGRPSFPQCSSYLRPLPHRVALTHTLTLFAPFISFLILDPRIRPPLPFFFFFGSLVPFSFHATSFTSYELLTYVQPSDSSDGTQNSTQSRKLEPKADSPTILSVTSSIYLIVSHGMVHSHGLEDLKTPQWIRTIRLRGEFI